MHLQLHFLATRFASHAPHARAGRQLGPRPHVVRGRGDLRARSVRAGYMTSDEWTLYRRLYAELLHSPAARPPRLLIYLQGPLDVITERIARARTAERKRSGAGLLAFAARAIRALDRALSPLPGVVHRRARIRSRRRQLRRWTRSRRACDSSWRASCRRRSCGRRCRAASRSRERSSARWDFCRRFSSFPWPAP